jgi:hypothetical protein
MTNLTPPTNKTLALEAVDMFNSPWNVSEEKEAKMAVALVVDNSEAKFEDTETFKLEERIVPLLEGMSPDVVLDTLTRILGVEIWQCSQCKHDAYYNLTMAYGEIKAWTDAMFEEDEEEEGS